MVYRELWPGVDLRFLGQKGLRYEFRVKPGARLTAIRLAYPGIGDLFPEADGGLRIETPFGTMRDAPAVAYQEIGRRQVPVRVAFTVSRGADRAATYGFVAGRSYDPRYPLLIITPLVRSSQPEPSRHDPHRLTTGPSSHRFLY